MKPLIAITPSYYYDTKKYSLTLDYADCVREAGGIPVIVCYGDNEILRTVSGIIFSGGGDIDPLILGEEPSFCGDISPIRDEAEFSLCAEAAMLEIPVFGICRGAQVIAGALGGEVYQDIYKETGAEVKHNQDAPGFHPTHTVKLSKGSLLNDIFGEETAVNSFHHQSVRRPPEGFEVCARSADGLIEAIEYTGGDWFALGVQWHPELMRESRGQMEIFKRLVKEAQYWARK